MEAGALTPGKCRLQKVRRALGVQGAKALPIVGRDVSARRWRAGGIVGVGDGVQVRRVQPGVLEAPQGGVLGKLPGRERNRALAVFAARETLLLGCGDSFTVDDERCGRVVKDGIKAKDADRCLLRLGSTLEVAHFERGARPQPKQGSLAIE
jgi:hypothetical protein